MALRPRINPKLNIFEPITFHTESDQLQLIAAIADKKSSGADVPKAITVNQISNADILKYFAILTLELIR